jgi:amidohydrolase
MNPCKCLILLSFLAFSAGAVLAAPAATAVTPGNSGPEQPAWALTVPAGKVVEWRRHIHQNPELSHREINTSNYIASVLSALGNIEVRRPAGNSVIGVLRGSRPGRTVAFRADMDALPVLEETGLPFASRVKGVSHACGHDTHIAMLLGTAATLSGMQKELRGTVYFVFQHAEETSPGGAEEIIKSGALKGVDAIFGLHVVPGYPAGHIGLLPKGGATTAFDVYNITINGKGSHGSMPQLGIDPIVAGAEIVTALQTIVSRNAPPGEMAVVTVGKFRAGDAPNIIPDRAELAVSTRSVAEPVRKLLAERIQAVVENVARAHGATYRLDRSVGPPAIRNDAALADLAKNAAVKALGAGMVFDAPRMNFSEDFAYYSGVAPVYYMILGIGPGAVNHNPRFNPDETALPCGVKVQTRIILDYLGR